MNSRCEYPIERDEDAPPSEREVKDTRTAQEIFHTYKQHLIDECEPDRNDCQ